MAGKEIKPIDKAAVHRICSGQVVLDLATAVKELVENSLDAGATSIEIRLKDYGAEFIEVADNGSGISPENYQGLTLKYYTSKISDFADLQSLSSFGFRGEALSSLCALGNVSIITRTKDEAFATRLVYDHAGVITSEEKMARAVGTTVSVGKLFSTLPVRHKEFNRNIRREYGRLLTILQAYALIGKGIKLVCSNQTGRGGRTTVVQTQGNASVKDNIVTVFGTKTAGCMEWLDLAVTESCYVEGFISKPGAGCGRAAGDRQFFYVNGRPVDMPKVAKLLNELYKSFNSLQYPMVVLNFILPTASYDVNVTPDKRKVFLHSESELMVALRDALEKVYSPNKYIYAVNDFDDVAISEGVDSTPKLAKNGSVRSVQEPSGEENPSDNEESTSGPEEDDEDDGFGLKSGGNRGGKKNSSDRFSADLFSFQRKPSSGSNSKKVPGMKIGSSRVNSLGQPARKLQTTLSACIAKRRRDAEADEGLLCEEPLLKKWSKEAASRKPTNTMINEEDDFEDEPSTLADDTPRNTDTECRLENTLSESDTFEQYETGDSAVPTRIRKVQSNSNLGVPPVGLKEDDDSVRLSTDENGAEPSELESGRFSNSKRDRASSEPSAKCQSGVQGTHQATVLKAKDDQYSVESSSKPDFVTRPKVSSNIALVAKGLADMRKKLAGSKVVAATALEAKHKNDTSTERVQLNVDSTTVGRVSNTFEFGTPPDEGLESEYSERPVPSEQCGTSRSQREGELAPSGLSVQFNIENLRKNFNQRCTFRDIKKEMTKRHEVPTRTSCFTAATLASGADKEGREKEEALAAATTELERSFNKADFKRMQVLGQFNLGFILAKIDQDIFIVDQHASDEKYNFERLTKNTVLNKQPLLRPLPLELSAADEITVITHMEVFRKNGFDFIEVEDAPTGQKLRLSAVPFSQNVTFGIGDVQELISLLADESVMSFGRRPDPLGISCNADSFSSSSRFSRPSKWLPRPSRVRAMLASRACRSSIMIGDPLSRKEMERILAHLAELDSPWNCPHGRPTMRHLVDLSTKCKRQFSTFSR
ncbi:hypothetical protein R1flu_017536 [Riccia fluitans]|uniref:DNA mismatch repair protein PMS1 n=1 Tax=Riccia fluitans TaxID=41844 RepID=A0ABD1ZDC0_9MARC